MPNRCFDMGNAWTKNHSNKKFKEKSICENVHNHKIFNIIEFISNFDALLTIFVALLFLLSR